MARRDGEECRVRDGRVVAGDASLLGYPDGPARVWAALRNPNAGDVLVSAAEGYEFTDLAGRHHAGGGSHGSLVAGDSEVPIVTVGLDGDPRVDRRPRSGRACALRDRHAPAREGGVTSAGPFDPVSSRHLMVTQQLRGRDIRDDRVLEAMRVVPRERFVPELLRYRAYEDAALPIGAGQTISQPYMVAAICQALQLHGGELVLDVGTGSGYQAAVLAELADEVHTIERVPELAEGARRALAEAGYERVHVHVGDGTLGVPEEAPFDAIAVAAAAPAIPESLYEQLAPFGRLVLPVGSRRGQELQLVVRSPEGPATIRSVPCRFVPLLGAEGFDD